MFGCSPATTYNRGIDVSYHPSAAADGGGRLVGSAVSLNDDADARVLRGAGGVYLGELEVVASRSGPEVGAGGASLVGRMSLEAATRGATHILLSSSSVEHGFERAGTTSYPVARTRVRFVLFRVEAAVWSQLPERLRPAPSA